MGIIITNPYDRSQSREFQGTNDGYRQAGAMIKGLRDRGIEPGGDAYKVAEYLRSIGEPID